MYIPTSFNAENRKHQAGINALKRYYQDKAVITDLPEKNDVGYDLEMSFNSHPEDIYAVEIKTCAGETAKGFQYPTWIVETWADHDMYKLPEWRVAKDLDYLMIFNRAKKRAYVYDVSQLRDYVVKNEHRQVSSGVGVGQHHLSVKKCAWGLKLDWECPEAGWMKTLDLSKHWP